jgi:putative membrane protein
VNYFSNFLKGILIGIGCIAPGVSGGVIAMIFGLYEKLMEAVSNFFKSMVKYTKFLLPIGLGGIIGIVGFSKVLKYVLDEFPMPSTYTIAGLIIGTLPILFKRANKKGFKKIYLIPFVITFTLAILLMLIEFSSVKPTAVSVANINTIDIVKLIIYGVIIAGSIVIPGISGSVILMILGVYGIVLGAIAEMNIVLLIPLAIGLGSGILLFSKLMDYLLNTQYSFTYYGILGFAIGSVPQIIQGFSLDFIGILSIFLLLIGIVVSYRISILEA